MYLKYLAALIVLAMAVFTGFFVGNKVSSGKITETNANIDIRATVKEILPASEYVSLVYQYTSVITHSEATKFLSFEIPLTEKKAIYTIDGAVKMGFNCAEMEIEIIDDAILLHMPRIRIIAHELFPETFSLYDESTSLFSRYSLKDANSIQLANKKAIEMKIRQNRRIYLQSRKYAEESFRLMIESLPGIKDKYTVMFDWGGTGNKKD